MVYNETAEHIETDSTGRVKAVVSKGGERFEADIAGCGLGLHFNYEFLPKEQIAIDYGIMTNERLETSVPDVFAGGDIAQFYDTDLDTHYTMGTWASATAHGRVAAQNMLGLREPVKDVRAYTTTLFDSRMTVIGATPEIRQDIDSVSHTAFEGTEPKKWNYRRLFFFDGRLVGAVLIGDMHAKVDLVNIIRSKKPVWEDRAALLHI
jgi:NAD(P)H-nitrite reductase large subunit